MMPNPVSIRVARYRIRDERRRQVTAEGFKAEDDDEYTSHELLLAGQCYLLHGSTGDEFPINRPPVDWPWPAIWWKPYNRERDLIRAGALFLAEEDRLRRIHSRKVQSGLLSVFNPSAPAELLARAIAELGSIYDRLHLVKGDGQ